MESKLLNKMPSPIDNILLIEPVWNRNKYVVSVGKTKEHLLIKPVWNRNASIVPPFAFVSVPFNRTSMESKRS